MSRRSRITNTSLSHRSGPVALASIAVLWLAACAPSDSGVTSPPLPGTDVAPSVGLTAAFGEPFPNLTPDQLALFTAGRDEFAAVEAVDEGLGPVFNEESCQTCHLGPGTAVGGTTGRLETRFGRTRSDGSFDPMAEFGGSLIQDHGIGFVSVPAGTFTFVGETVPPEATMTARRRTQPLFGLGLVDATPESTFRSIALLQAIFAPQIAGTPSVVPDPSTGSNHALGQFGWKAQVPSLFVFSGDAYLNEMGITTPLFPNENCPQGKCELLQFNPADNTPNDDGTGVVRFNDFMKIGRAHV